MVVFVAVVVELEKRLVVEGQRRMKRWRGRGVEIEEVLKLSNKLPKHGKLFFHAQEEAGQRERERPLSPPLKRNPPIQSKQRDPKRGESPSPFPLSLLPSSFIFLYISLNPMPFAMSAHDALLKILKYGHL